MNKITGITALGALTGAVLLTGMILKHSTADTTPADTTARTGTHAGMAKKRVPVIVEMFTSEGCSSCPPADTALMELQKDQPVDDALIIPLSEHVDYWNSIGWTDPFSAKAFSNRQSEYSTAFHLDGVYTPQAVVDGRKELVGSDKEAALSAIRRAAEQPKADVQITATQSGTAITGLNVRIEDLPAVSRSDRADVVLALTENHLSSHVARGENSGRHLSHTAVVRQLKTIGTVTPGQVFTANPALTLNSAWKRGDLNAVIFVQEHNSRHILGAALLPLK